MDEVRRRLLSRLPLVLLAGSLGVPAVHAQSPRSAKPVRIGRLSPLAAATDAANMTAFRKGLADLGWIEGQDFVIEYRFADGKADRLPALAAQLVRDGVDLILSGSTPGALAAQRATKTIPIVIITTGDPVADGIVQSLAHPGGNVTGITTIGQVLDTKRLELLKEAFPAVSRVVVILDPSASYTAGFTKVKDAAARSLGVEVQTVGVSDAAEFERIPALVAARRAGALLVQTNVLFIAQRPRLVQYVNATRLPVVYGEREFVEHGGLMFYGASLATMYRDAAGHADRILKGARPADLPVVQPTKLELVVNAKTARALGMALPPTLLLRADRVIE